MPDHPLIGVCSRWNLDTGEYRLHPRDCRWITECGGTPVVLPFDFDRYDVLDGIVFTGGADVGCGLGRYEDSPLVHYDAPERDAAEVRHAKAALSAGMPILAICRGYQLLNCVLGGSLIRDIAEAGFPDHVTEDLGMKDGIHQHFHAILTEPGSLMRELFGEEASVLSLHHQAVREPAPGFLVSAHSPDGVTEAFESRERRILAMQTHPEMMGYTPPFRWLVREAAAYQITKKKD